MFIKTRDNMYIPMIETGDNNVYDGTGRNARRSRDWHQLYFEDGRLVHTREEIMQEVDRRIEKVVQKHVNKPKDSSVKECWTIEEIRQSYGYFAAIAISGNHTTNTSARQVRNFFLRGFEQAVSMDNERVIMDLHWCTGYPNYEHRYFSSEEELLKAWNEERSNGHTLWLSYKGCAESLWLEHHRKAVRRERSSKQPEEMELSQVMKYSDYEKQAKVGERILVKTGDLSRRRIYSRQDVYKVVSTTDQDGIILRKHGCRILRYFPRTSGSYGYLYAAILTDDEYEKLSA